MVPQVVSITSQGQISIPARIRRELGLYRFKKALVRTEKKKVVVEPLPDLLSLGGSLKPKASQGKTIGEIIRLEKEASAQAAVERYRSSLK